MHRSVQDCGICNYLLSYPMIDHSAKVVDKVASYYCCTRGSFLDCSSQVIGFLRPKLFSIDHADSQIATAMGSLPAINYWALISALVGFKAKVQC